MSGKINRVSAPPRPREGEALRQAGSAAWSRRTGEARPADRPHLKDYSGELEDPTHSITGLLSALLEQGRAKDLAGFLGGHAR